MSEIWKDIYFWENGIEWDYRGLYQVSNYGNVKSLNYNHTGKEQILKAGKNNRGYLGVNLYKNKKRKRFSIHRLVAYVFISNPENLPEVNHTDENKENNHVSNLEWCTRKYNNNYGNHIEKISEANKGKTRNKGKKHTEETRQKMSESKKGHEVSDETRLKMSKSHNGVLIERWRNNVLIDIKYHYEYVQMGFNSGNISAVCRGKLKSTSGFIFKYHKE